MMAIYDSTLEGVVAKLVELATGAKGSVFKPTCAQYIFKTPPVHPVGNEYPTFFRPGEGKGGEENEWHPVAITPQVGPLDDIAYDVCNKMNIYFKK